MADKLPTFQISTQQDPYWEIPLLDTAGEPLSIDGRVFEAWISVANVSQGTGETAPPIKVLKLGDGLSIVTPTDKPDVTVKNTLVHRMSRQYAQDNLPRGELTADILEVVDGSRRLFIPVRLRYQDPAAIRDFVPDAVGVTFGGSRQAVVTPVAIAGREGARGSGFLTGQRAPTTADGENGDYWIDASNGVRVLYGPKANGVWPVAGDPFVTDLTPALEQARDATVTAAAEAADHASTTQADRQAVETSTVQVETARQEVATNRQAVALDKDATSGAKDIAQAAANTASTQAGLSDTARQASEAARDVVLPARDLVVSTKDTVVAARDQAVTAATTATAKAGQFATLAALQAIPAPTVITAAEVTSDGTNNGGYQYDPANAAAGWVKKSSATVPAIDARTAAFDPTEGNAAGDLYVILDEIRRVLGRYDVAGRLHTQFGPRMPFGAALLDADAPDNMDGDLFVLPDVDGRVLLLIRANGEIIGKITSPEIIAARGSKASLADRLTVSVLPNGLLRTSRWGRAYLRQAHMRLMQRSLGVATQIDIVAIGDSYTDTAARWLQQFTERLVARYGDAGPGFVSFANRRGGARPTLAVPDYAGAWTTASWTAQTADTTSLTSSTAGNTATCTIPAGMSDVTLLYLPTTDGAVRYRFRPTDAWTPLALTGTGVALLSGLPAEASTLTIEVTGGTVSLNAVNIRSAAPGVRVHKCAISGVRAKFFAETDGPVRRAHYAALGGHCYTIMLGANDQPGYPASEFRTYLDAMVAGIRAVSTVADLAFIAPPENNLARARPMKDYAQVHYEVAVANGGAFLDLQADFGPDPALYASNGAFPLMLADGLHPDPATGGYLIASAALEAFTVD